MPTQQQGYLTAAERTEFAAYAKEHGLHATALGRLLIIRELKLRRLTRLLSRFGDQPVAGRRKLTVHITDPVLKSAFGNLARKAGVSPSAAAAAVFRAELTERWLSASVGQEGKGLTEDST